MTQELKQLCKDYITSYTNFLNHGNTDLIASLGKVKDEIKSYGKLSSHKLEVEFVLSNLDYMIGYSNANSIHNESHQNVNSENLYTVISSIETNRTITDIISEIDKLKCDKVSEVISSDKLSLEVNSKEIHFKAMYDEDFKPSFIIYRSSNLFFGDIAVKLGRFGNIIDTNKISLTDLYGLNSIIKIIILKEIGYFKLQTVKPQKLYTLSDMDEIVKICNTIHAMESIKTPPQDFIEVLYKRLNSIYGR